MGFSADAKLIYGRLIYAFDKDVEPTQFWDEDNDDWIDLEVAMLKRDGHSDPSDEVPPEIWNGYDDAAFETWKAQNPAWEDRMAAWRAAKRALTLNVAIQTYGHFEDEGRAILTPTRIEAHSAPCWSPTKISTFDGLAVSDKAISKANDDCRALGFDVNFYGEDDEQGWWLVASYG